MSPTCWQADAIVANPISYGGPHLADHLGVPLHYLFTMPYSTTSVRPAPDAPAPVARSDSNESGCEVDRCAVPAGWQRPHSSA